VTRGAATRASATGFGLGWGECHRVRARAGRVPPGSGSGGASATGFGLGRGECHRVRAPAGRVPPGSGSGGASSTGFGLRRGEFHRVRAPAGRVPPGSGSGGASATGFGLGRGEFHPLRVQEWLALVAGHSCGARRDASRGRSGRGGLVPAAADSRRARCRSARRPAPASGNRTPAARCRGARGAWLGDWWDRARAPERCRRCADGIPRGSRPWWSCPRRCVSCAA
jgi:hypothetical protein